MFFYLKQTGWSPKTESFYSIKVDGEFNPCDHQSRLNDESTKFEAFIQGIGHKSAKKGYKIPVYKGETIEELQAYIDKYGKYSLFYSITGFSLASSDCVVWHMRQELNVALSIGFDYVEKFTKRINELNSKIQQIVLDKHGVDVLSGQFQKTKQGKFIGSYDLFYVKPSYSIMAYFLTKPHVDVISDDDKLWKHYVSLTDISEVDKGKFPVQMRARLEFLFSKEVSDDYEAIMNEFTMS